MPTDEKPSAPASETPTLAPVLGLVTAIALVIGQVIGSGIFFKPNQVAQGVGGYVGLILALWTVCGLVNLCGALTMAELSAMLPHAGGTYVFLREAYGRLWGFLWGWGEFWVMRSGAIAALATAMATSLLPLFKQCGWIDSSVDTARYEGPLAIASILGLMLVNIAGTRLGGAVQVVTTLLKAGFLVFLAVLPFLAMRGPMVSLEPLFPGTSGWPKLAGLGAALGGIMWAYDGWGQLTVVAEEIKNPGRNVPLALALGVVLLIALYVAANLAYHLTLPTSEIAKAEMPAAAVTEKLFPRYGSSIMLAMVAISAFGALSSNILVGPRVLFAVARDHSPLRMFCRIDPRTQTPAIAIAAMSIWSVLLIVASRFSPDQDRRLFDILTNYTIFGGSVFYLAAVVAVFILRKKRPDAPRPYRTWGYPIVPAIFVGFYVFLLASMFVAAWFEPVAGLCLIAVGAVAYWLIGRRSELESAC